MEDFAIVIFSCDKNDDLWPVFNHCLNKYWKDHPITYLLTETKKCKFFKTINFDYPLEKWSLRMRKSLLMVKEKKILFICDDVFLREKVNQEKLKEALDLLKDDIACIQLETSVCKYDVKTEHKGFRRKTKYSPYKVSFFCGLWQRDKLIDILDGEKKPWDMENEADTNADAKGYTYYQISGDKILSWFNDATRKNGAIRYGAWQEGIYDFLQKEGLADDMDFSKRIFVSQIKKVK